MKVSRFFVLSIALLMVIGLTVSANAALTLNGEGTIVTQTRNDGSTLMWLQDTYTAYHTGYCSIAGNCESTGDTYMDFSQATDWIAHLNSTNYLGYNDWRLPDTLPVNGIAYDYDFSADGSTDTGYNNTSLNSELGYMYYVELGNLAPVDTSGDLEPSYTGNYNSGPFYMFGYNPNFWSGTEYTPDDEGSWNFNYSTGQQFIGNKTYSSIPWAMRTVVPEPISSTLFLIGGATLGFRRFRKRAKVQ